MTKKRAVINTTLGIASEVLYALFIMLAAFLICLGLSAKI